VLVEQLVEALALVLERSHCRCLAEALELDEALADRVAGAGRSVAACFFRIRLASLTSRLAAALMLPTLRRFTGFGSPFGRGLSSACVTVTRSLQLQDCMERALGDLHVSDRL
jgi:hypothetical protein